jgi:hypothetical protein
MCHGEEWEQYLLAQQREFERRKREKAEGESRKSTATAPPKPAEVPAKTDDLVPV